VYACFSSAVAEDRHRQLMPSGEAFEELVEQEIVTSGNYE
jgi:hypothetical protein